MIARNEVHLFLTRLDHQVEERLPGAWALLDDSERARAERFVIERPRIEYILSHCLVRTALAACTGAEPRDFKFREMAFGKPEITAPARLAGVRFNLSHTRGLAACAVAQGREVGVDVEHKSPRVLMLEVAERVFSPAENAALLLLPEAQQRDVFFTRWSLKEAVMKATGEGFQLSPERLEIPLQSGQTEVESASLDGEDILPRWYFRIFRPSPEHSGALVVEAMDRAEIVVVEH